MTIGIVLPEAPGYSETFFYSKIKGLISEGHKVILFVNNNSGNFNLCEVVAAEKVDSKRPIIQVFKLIFILAKLFIKAPAAMNALNKFEKADGTSLKNIFEKIYINAHILPYKLHWLHFGFATMAVKRENVAKAIGAKMAVSFRGYDISIYPVKNKGCYNKLWQKVDKVHSISDDLYQEALKLGLSEKVAYQKINPAIDSGKFVNKKQFLKINEPVKLVTVGRLNWKKGIEYAIAALGLLSKRGIDFKYNIIGTGTEYERLIFAAYQLGIEEKINFLGKKSHEEVVTYLADSDIYLQPSIQEGFCNAVLEAQAMGLLCIVSDAEGLPENVVDGKTGWVVPKRNSEALAKKIEEVLHEDNVLLANIQNRAVERVKAQFNISNQIRDFINFYSN
ncbi:MAG: glycosyltransferase [Bacteroidota bacterium]|nr:glycosyltransferase [Bacteroidota bacterium]